MTLVRFLLTQPSPTGRVPAKADLRCTPTRSRVVTGDPDELVLPVPFVQALVSGTADVDLEPTSAAWTWKIEVFAKGTPNFTRHVAVPNVPEIDFTDLVDVDPDTLDPTAVPEPAWYGYVDTMAATALLSSEAAEVSRVAAVAARDAASGSQGSAAASATAAGNSATAASNSATAAGNSATAAGSSAFNAGNSASAALGHKNAAADSALAASGSAGSAELARSTMVNGGSVSPAGRLILDRVAAAPVDAGYVVGPPLTAVVVDTVTGPETPGATGAQGLKGDKGDAGGLTAAVFLGANYDLNLLITPGTYRSDSNTATIATNHPQNGLAANIIVTATGPSLVTQIAYPLNGALTSRLMWIRSYNTSAWQPWRVFASSRVDQTAGRAMYQYDDLNNREQLVYGDTGLRMLSMDNGYLGTLTIRRVGLTVTLLGSVKRPPGLSMNGTFLVALPAGFGPASVAWTFFPARHNGLAAWHALYRRNNELTFEGATGDTDGTECRFEISWTTNQPWPTTLPGTASGTIPNL